jgi:hypothetical protein
MTRISFPLLSAPGDGLPIEAIALDYSLLHCDLCMLHMVFRPNACHRCLSRLWVLEFGRYLSRVLSLLCFSEERMSFAHVYDHSLQFKPKPSS